MKFLVTGGAGFIGSNLATELNKIGEVIIIDDLSTGNMENIKSLIDEGVEFTEASILDYDKLLKISMDVDYIFHLAALPSVTRSINNPVKTNEVNVSGTLNVLEAARKNNVKKVVYASSSSVYGDTPTLPKKESMKPDPLSPYAVSKLTAEHYCNVYNHIFKLPTVALRYFNVYGPHQNPHSEYSAVIPIFITKTLGEESLTINGDGSITRDFTYIKDVVQANIQAMKKDSVGVYNASYGGQTSLNKLAQLIMEYTGNQVEIKYGPKRPGDVQDSYADITKSKMTLDYNPEYNIEKGLKETIKWYKNYLKN